MLAPPAARLISLLLPQNDVEARLKIEQLRIVAQTFRSTAIAIPIMALVVGAIALQWVSIWHILPWFAAVVASVLLAFFSSRRMLSRTWALNEAGKASIEMLAGIMPFLTAWPLIVVVAWVDGNSYNNAFLVTFMFASIAAGVPLGSPCLQFVIANGFIDFPILATHTIGGTPVMAWLAPVLQIVGGIFLYDLSFTHNRLIKASVLQRFEKGDLVERITRTAAQLEIALDEAKRANNAKSVFLAGMSHELRTPLNAIIGFSDAMRQHVYGPLSPPRYGEYVEDIHNSGQHLLGLINNILDIAKIESGTREFSNDELNMTRIARNALRFVETQARKSGVSLRCEIEEPVRLVADELAMTQMLTNLLSNAVKFTGPGGRVTAFARPMAGGGLAVGVADTGIGMSEADLEKSMQLYGQASNAMTVEGHGTGLGLSIVQALLHAQGAAFHITSRLGEGTSVWGEFPPSRIIASSIAVGADTLFVDDSTAARLPSRSAG